ncbi:hypothetical protein NEOLI_004731 [Neolecta irregularis DAH-3]|uniref:Uncharacterized protein n=1 Tax=Neolecta irregularis (strain DAH-3) TaxID=1198029 RepID=A0A1U7LTG6_NEOID|nr:hypothetical protein NEOLI_004731 [Neolecta irregularis DAH-3]|eukprot:OLL25957.1 hypothetical protein NEOLI_004731 [Neolecta irregularis DAH-3]
MAENSSRLVVQMLVAGMLVSGVMNTILSKYQDLQCVENCNSPGRARSFEQPVWQTLNMFLAESLCWVILGLYRLFSHHSHKVGYEPIPVHYDSPAVETLLERGGKRQHMHGNQILLLALPALCDIFGTTLMNTGLLFTPASIFQMTRGALVLFVGLFSVVFLRSHLRIYHWISLVLVVLGVCIVGFAGAIYSDHSVDSFSAIHAQVNKDIALKTLLGVMLILCGQLFTATQFVFEEHILEKYSLEPLKVVCWEGTFGLMCTLIAMLVLHFAYGAGTKGYFDIAQGWSEVTSSPKIWGAAIAIMFSISSFNFFGLSVTRTVSATARSTIDTLRTLGIWVLSLYLGWETFKWLQVIGFIVLVYGTFVFNGIVRMPWQKEVSDEEFLPEEPTEHF